MNGKLILFLFFFLKEKIMCVCVCVCDFLFLIFIDCKDKSNYIFQFTIDGIVVYNTGDQIRYKGTKCWGLRGEGGGGQGKGIYGRVWLRLLNTLPAS